MPTTDLDLLDPTLTFSPCERSRNLIVTLSATPTHIDCTYIRELGGKDCKVSVMASINSHLPHQLALTPYLELSVDDVDINLAFIPNTVLYVDF